MQIPLLVFALVAGRERDASLERMIEIHDEIVDCQAYEEESECLRKSEGGELFCQKYRVVAQSEYLRRLCR